MQLEDARSFLRLESNGGSSIAVVANAGGRACTKAIQVRGPQHDCATRVGDQFDGVWAPSGHGHSQKKAFVC